MIFEKVSLNPTYNLLSVPPSLKLGTYLNQLRWPLLFGAGLGDLELTKRLSNHKPLPDLFCFWNYRSSKTLVECLTIHSGEFYLIATNAKSPIVSCCLNPWVSKWKKNKNMQIPWRSIFLLDAVFFLLDKKTIRLGCWFGRYL